MYCLLKLHTWTDLDDNIGFYKLLMYLEMSNLGNQTNSVVLIYNLYHPVTTNVEYRERGRDAFLLNTKISTFKHDFL